MVVTLELHWHSSYAVVAGSMMKVRKKYSINLSLLYVHSDVGDIQYT